METSIEAPMEASMDAPRVGNEITKGNPIADREESDEKIIAEDDPMKDKAIFFPAMRSMSVSLSVSLQPCTGF